MMTINVEHIYKTHSSVHYFPGNFVVDYDPQTIPGLVTIITEAIINHNFEQATAYDPKGQTLMTITRT